MHAHARHHGNERATRILRFSLVVTLAYIVLLVVAGVRSHSLALLSEAGHNLSDFFALLLSLIAVYLQSRPPSATKTYGYHRAGVLAALPGIIGTRILDPVNVVVALSVYTVALLVRVCVSWGQRLRAPKAQTTGTIKEAR